MANLCRFSSSLASLGSHFYLERLLLLASPIAAFKGAIVGTWSWRFLNLGARWVFSVMVLWNQNGHLIPYLYCHLKF